MIRRITLVLVAAFLVVGNVMAQPAIWSRTDALGDPLPEGAIARLGTLRFKHTPAKNGTIDMAIFSPDGTKAVSLVSGLGSIRLWNTASGKEISGPWDNANLRFSSCAFSPDGKLLAVGINPGFRPNPNVNTKVSRDAVILYDIATSAQVKNLAAQPHNVQAVGFADEGKTLIAAGDGIIRWWDVATGKEQKSWTPFAEEEIEDRK